MLAGCTSQPIQNIENLSVPTLIGGADLSLDQVGNAIITGSINRGWTPQTLSPGLIEARITVRTHVAVVEIPYTDTSFGIRYKDSSNLDYRNGSIHRNYNRWVANLRIAIQQQLNLQIQSN